MDEYPNIFFKEFNQRRKMRGADAARFEVYYSDNERELLWMSKTDIRKNMKNFPHCTSELLRGLAAYCDIMDIKTENTIACGFKRMM